MNKGLTIMEKFKLIRPIIGPFEVDENHFPVINKTSLEHINWSKIEPLNFKNMVAGKSNENKIILMFSYDKNLKKFWENPLKYIPQFSTAALIGTPDFSVYESMNYNDIRYNIYKSRWLGKTWQNYGCKVLVTIQWAGPDTYDICFSGVEKGSPVAISTLGCQDNEAVFLAGFNEMKKRIMPELIVVVGDMIPGMTGKFINFKYVDTFSKNKDYEQLSFLEVNPIFEIKEDL